MLNVFVPSDMYYFIEFVVKYVPIEYVLKENLYLQKVRLMSCEKRKGQ